MSFSQGLSGLNAASKALDVVGNNIANSQTYGFKSGSIAFADIFAGTSGLGVQVAGVNQNFAEGGLVTTNRNLDMGISGKGFFRMVNEGGSVLYGRNGQFDLDASGNIINKTNGLFLTGYQATGTPPAIQPGSPVGPIQVPSGDMPPAASTTGKIAGNLDASDKKIANTPFDSANEDTYNYTSQVEAYDSLGNKHTLKLYFAQETAGDWKVHAIDETSPGTSGNGFSDLALTFDQNGNLTGNGTINITGDSLNGSAALSVNLDLSGMTKFSGENQVKLDKIDGQSAGKYQSFSIGDSGEVIATYSNGQRQTVAQIVLADFANSGGLAAEGNNVWSETPQSGQPYLGLSGSGSFGAISGGALEQSNVDLGQEMVNMIVYQRNYQSNSQTIKTQSELLQTLVNMR
ncbi:flagellar hook protein FlgE [Pantoea agglomerans]|uniref:flagellar hook protein FlgE n=1 Tax=Enterobacter agglomerans TaxID=549 RepID=UPI001042ED16|nr:flagellar hook protein FlgE [Pantoea agglomerans]TCZ24240.1 flagellar hook protein FlgE [Pantoea agglomerans]